MTIDQIRNRSFWRRNAVSNVARLKKCLILVLKAEKHETFQYNVIIFEKVFWGKPD